jgi:hypothetical protein
MEPDKHQDDWIVVTVRGSAGPTVRAAFGDLQLTVVGSTTELRGSGSDQATLHGILQRAQDLGLEVVEVHHELGIER